MVSGYSYVLGNPTNWLDPSGLCPQSAGPDNRLSLRDLCKMSVSAAQSLKVALGRTTYMGGAQLSGTIPLIDFQAGGSQGFGLDQRGTVFHYTGVLFGFGRGVGLKPVSLNYTESSARTFDELGGVSTNTGMSAAYEYGAGYDYYQGKGYESNSVSLIFGIGLEGHMVVVPSQVTPLFNVFSVTDSICNIYPDWIKPFD
jgi:hypothetical protein